MNNDKKNNDKKNNNLKQNITELIGATPVLQLNRLPQFYFSEQEQATSATVFVKLEKFNPSGSVKDRAANQMIVAAEENGTLKPGATIIEPTSGNTGIGIAMNAAAKGYRAILVMPDNMSIERIRILKAYGAEVVLTPAAERMGGAVNRALELQSQIEGSIILQQFENPANPNVHRATTAQEIIAQMEKELDAFVAVSGTGGTMTGTAETLRAHWPDLPVFVVEPKGSPVLSGGQPGPHKLVGTSPGFIPAILNTEIYDEIIQVSDEDALDICRQLARYEGLLVGPSSAAAVWAALQVAKRIGPNKKVLCIAPDSGERYLSMDIFS
jgi:cysteine synthase A